MPLTTETLKKIVAVVKEDVAEDRDRRAFYNDLIDAFECIAPVSQTPNECLGIDPVFDGIIIEREAEDEEDEDEDDDDLDDDCDDDE
jgi:hypothetical protein